MKKLLGISIALGTCFQANSQTSSKASSLQVKSYEGTMRDNLPLPSNATKKTEILYPRPGEVSFSTQVYCGDGDVANYYAAHTNEAYLHGLSTQKVAMGYWVTSGSERVPDASSWFLMGFGDIASTGGFTNQLHLANTLANNSKTQMKVSEILRQELSKLKNQFSVLNSSRDVKTFNVYAGTMLCNSYEDSSGTANASNSPTGASIANSLIEYFKTHSEKDVVSHSDLYDGSVVAKATASGVEGALSVSFSKGSSSNVYDQALSKLRALDCKDICLDPDKSSSGPAKNMGDYRGYVKGLLDNLTILSSSCQTQLKKGSNQYWWESVPLSLDCQNVGDASFASLVKSLSGDSKSSGDEALSLEDFNKIKSDLRVKLGRASLMRQLQDSLKSQNISQNKGRCFPVGRPYVETVIASLPFSFTATKSSLGTPVVTIQGSKSVMTMPEPNYISIAGRYYQNENAVFMAPGDAMIMDITQPPPSISFGAGINFPMHVRDVGCSNGPTYCNLEDRDHFFERFN